MALLRIQSDWYIYFWLLYCKIYSAIIWLFGNHCRGTDKARAVITSGIGGQSLGSLHRVRTRRKKTQQYHRTKHVVALARRPSYKRIVMAPGASTAHAMMEDKEKLLAPGEIRFLFFSYCSKFECIIINLTARRDMSSDFSYCICYYILSYINLKILTKIISSYCSKIEWIWMYDN